MAKSERLGARDSARKEEDKTEWKARKTEIHKKNKRLKMTGRKKEEESWRQRQP